MGFAGAEDRSWPAGQGTAGTRVRAGPSPHGGTALRRGVPGAAQAGHRPGQEGNPARARGPIRGFPPVPGLPDPVYPPGQFSLWNRPSVRAAWLGLPGASDSRSEAEPGYSVLAVSDPSADATSTQTWPAIEADPGLADWEPAAPVPEPRPPAGPAGPGREPSPQRAAPPGRVRAGAGPVTGSAPVTGAGAGRDGAAGWLGERGPGTATVSPAFTGEAAGLPRAGETAGWPRADGAVARREPAAEGAARHRDGRDGGPPPARSGRAPGRAARRAARPGKRSHAFMAALLLAPVLVVVLVAGGYVYLASHHPAPAAAPPGHTGPSPSAGPPSPSLGPWKHIESRSQDARPLTLRELFPAKAGGQAGTRTVAQSSRKCTHALIGSKLRAAVRKAGCTQVLRASYLSANRKLMATIGVLNLINAAAAQQAGKASGAAEFIKPLPSAHGPTRRLSRGTGLEEADVMGHYLILTWAEFTSLHKPSGSRQLRELRQFSTALITGTANISLSSRMMTGQPATG
jgi:hypothetical protein